jgi:hypothetical protein
MRSWPGRPPSRSLVKIGTGSHARCDPALFWWLTSVTCCARRKPAGPARDFCSFATEISACWYAVELARTVRQAGFTGLRPRDLLPERSRPARSERILASEIIGLSHGWDHGSLRAIAACPRTLAPDTNGQAMILSGGLAGPGTERPVNGGRAEAATMRTEDCDGVRIIFSNSLPTRPLRRDLR